MTMQQIPVILVWAVAAALLVGYAASVASEITYVTLADGRKTERKIPLIFRLLLPFVSNLSRVVMRPAFAKARANADWMIVACGLEGLLTGAEFMALKVLVPLVCGSVCAVLVLALCALVPDSFLSSNSILLVLMGYLYFYAYPLIIRSSGCAARSRSATFRSCWHCRSCWICSPFPWRLAWIS